MARAQRKRGLCSAAAVEAHEDSEESLVKAKKRRVASPSPDSDTGTDSGTGTGAGTETGVDTGDDDSSNEDEENDDGLAIPTDQGTQTQESETTDSLETIFQKLGALREHTEEQTTRLRDMERVLDGKEQAALQRLELLRAKLNDDKTRFEECMRGLFETALCPVDTDEAGTGSVLSIQKQALGVHLHDLLDDCRQLTATYRSSTTSMTTAAAAEGRNARTAAALASDLDKDTRAMRSSIAAGLRAVQRDMPMLAWDDDDESIGTLQSGGLP